MERYASHDQEHRNICIEMCIRAHFQLDVFLHITLCHYLYVRVCKTLLVELWWRKRCHKSGLLTYLLPVLQAWIMKCHFGISSTVDPYNQDYDWFCWLSILVKRTQHLRMPIVFSVDCPCCDKAWRLTEKDGDGYINLWSWMHVSMLVGAIVCKIILKSVCQLVCRVLWVTTVIIRLAYQPKFLGSTTSSSKKL